MKQYEVFQDACYYDLYCVRATDDRDFEHTLHFLKKEEALHAKEVLEHWTKSIYCEMHDREKGLVDAVSEAIKELPESKSPSADKPETCASCKHDCKREEACECYTPKTCVNCGKYLTSFEDGCAGSCYDSCPNWQPKPAEAKAKGWEQRFDTFWKSYADKEDVLYTWNNCQRRKDELLSFIRAEIERVREEAHKTGYNRACEEYGPIARAQGEQIGKNKHREKK